MSRTSEGGLDPSAYVDRATAAALAHSQAWRTAVLHVSVCSGPDCRSMWWEFKGLVEGSSAIVVALIQELQANN